MNILASLKHEASALQADGRGLLLGTIAGGWGILLGTRMIYPVLLSHLQTSFGFSLTVAGLLITILWLGSAVGQLPGGILADRYGQRLVMAVSAIIAAIGVGFVAGASTTITLFAATALVGLGQSLYPIPRITMIAEIYPDRVGSALGVTMAAGDLGQTILPPIAGVLALVVAWQLGFIFMIPLLLLIGVLLWVVLPETTESDSPVDSLSLESVRYVLAELRRNHVLFVTFIFFLYIVIWQSFTGFYPTYLVEVKGMSPSTAGVIFSVFFAFGVIVKPLAGMAYDRFGMRSALVSVLIGPVAALVTLPFLDDFWPLVGVTAVVSTMLGSGAITQSYMSDVIPNEIHGTALGAIRTSVATIGALGPVVFGSIADRGYFDEGYLVLAAVLVVIIVLTLRLPHASRTTTT